MTDKRIKTFDEVFSKKTPLEDDFEELLLIANAAARFKSAWETPCLSCDEGIETAPCSCTDVTEYREQLFKKIKSWQY